MAGQAEREDDLADDLDQEAELPDNQDDEDAGGDPPGDDEDDEEDELEVLFGDEAAPGETQTETFQEMRKRLNESLRENAELKRARQVQEAPKPVEVGPRPKIDDEDIHYDEDAHAAAVEAWVAKKAEADVQVAEQTKAQEQQRAAVQADFARFTDGKAKIGARDFDMVEATVANSLSPEQASALIQASEDSAKLIYALGKHPQRLKELAGEKNIVKFIARVAKMEGGIQVKSKRTAPEPDRPVRGSAPFTATSDKHMAKLEAAADKSGDRTALINYRREKRAKAAAK